MPYFVVYGQDGGKNTVWAEDKEAAFFSVPNATSVRVALARDIKELEREEELSETEQT